jgi:hypothetical protein
MAQSCRGLVVRSIDDHMGVGAIDEYTVVRHFNKVNRLNQIEHHFKLRDAQGLMQVKPAFLFVPSRTQLPFNGKAPKWILMHKLIAVLGTMLIGSSFAYVVFDHLSRR